MTYPGACHLCGFQEEQHAPDGDAWECEKFAATAGDAQLQTAIKAALRLKGTYDPKKA